jgi:hypothetical protein
MRCARRWVRVASMDVFGALVRCEYLVRNAVFAQSIGQAVGVVDATRKASAVDWLVVGICCSRVERGGGRTGRSSGENLSLIRSRWRRESAKWYCCVSGSGVELAPGRRSDVGRRHRDG